MPDINERTPELIDFFGCAREYQKLESEILLRASAVLSAGILLQGPEVLAFEERIRCQLGRAYAVSVGSGTDALFFALVSLGIGNGDEVLIANLSFIASATAILRTGARPVFVDIGDDCNMDLEKAEKRLSSKTKAILFVHLFGGMGNPKKIETFARLHNISVLEDCAQSFGATFGARPSGKIGEVGALSFDPTKVIGAPGSGGMIVTDDSNIAMRVRRLRLHGKESEKFIEMGYNSQLSSLCAAILDIKLNYQKCWTTRRKTIANIYLNSFDGLPISIPKWHSSVSHTWHKFVICANNRDELAKHLFTSGIPTRIHYATPLHKIALFESSQEDDEFPLTSKFCKHTLSLPIHSHLTDEEVHKIVNCVTKYFG